MTFLPPDQLGLPQKFSVWRPEQEDALWNAVGSDKRFAVLGMPTGSGKSLVAAAVANLLGGRTLVLTSTKGLQEQYLRDFAEVGLLDVRGMNNYTCKALMPDGCFYHLSDGRSINCDRGPCLSGLQCDLRTVGCNYYDTVARASDGAFVVTNYSYWIANRMNVAYRGRESTMIGDFDTIILDEAHDAPDELCGALAIEITIEDVSILTPTVPASTDIGAWRTWATQVKERIGKQVAELEALVKLQGASRSHVVDLLHGKTLLTKLNRLSSLEGRWVVETSGKGGYIISPVWPAPYAESMLFAGASKIVLMSATLRPKTAELLGISDFEWAEYASSFPVQRRPFYHVPTVVMNHRIDEASKRYWADRIGQIVRARPHRKGIIHTVSYDRAKYLIENLDTAGVPVFTHNSYTTRQIVEKFKKAKAGVIISPSLSTGYDFPYELCQYQIIAKVPWPDTRGAVMQARRGIDKEYPAYIAVQQLVQMSGRGMRAADDFCETFIVDDFIRAMLASYRHLFPASFLETVRSCPIIPAEPAA